MTFDPMSVEVTCVTLPKDHCVQVPWKYINVCGYSDQFGKLPHTYTYYIHTYYVQNEWSHSLLLNSVQARQNWNRLQITLTQVKILNWRELHQFSLNSFRLVLWQTNKRWRQEKVTTPGSQNLACLVRLYSRGQWTIAEAKLESSLCIEIYRRFPFPLCYFIPRYYQTTELRFKKHVFNNCLHYLPQ